MTEKKPGEEFAKRDAKVRELFDISNRVLAAQFLEKHALDESVALRTSDEVRQTILREAEKTWEDFRVECQFRPDHEIDDAIRLFRQREASLPDTRTLMDHLCPDNGQGSKGGQEPAVRPLTNQLIDCCYLDVWPGNAAIVDFGIDSDRHLGALQFAVREQLVTPQELDAAMGNGPKLTEIARRGSNPYRDVTFSTSYDWMAIEPEGDKPDQPKSPGTEGSGKSDFHRALDEAAKRPSPGPKGPGHDVDM